MLSLLYPFKFEFYRRMGWGVAARMAEFKIPPAQFAAYGRVAGRVRRVLYSEKGELEPVPGETVDSVITKLEPVYEAAASAFNLAARRRRDDWIQAFTMRSGRRHVFVWERDEVDGPGRVEGYVMIRIRDEREFTDLVVREIFAVTPEAWRGLFFFLSCHDSQNRFVRVNLPAEHPMLDLLSDPRGFELERWTTGPMARAVDVAGLLEARGRAFLEGAGAAGSSGRSPQAGSCLIHVRDPLAPWNDGTFALRLDGTAVLVEKPVDLQTPHEANPPGTGSPDLEVDIDAFSTLATGARRVEDLIRFGLATGRAGPGLDLAAEIFPSRTIWHTEYY